MATTLFILSIANSASAGSIANLSAFSTTEAKKFLNSFDTIVTDCDGVLWNRQPIPGVREVVGKLKSMGKKLYFLSNFSGKTREFTKAQFQEIGIDLKPKDLIHPIGVIIDYLKSKKFAKKIFLIGSNPTASQFEEAGIRYVRGLNDYSEDLGEFLRNITMIDDEIGAVVVDVDFKINYYKINRAVVLLNDPEILYLSTGTEKFVKLEKNLTLAGAGYVGALISEISGRRPMLFGKPSSYLVPLIFKQFNVTDPRRTLFIGDTLTQDMGMATLCGFQKLFVLSGTDILKTAENNPDPAYKPDYWIESLGHLKGVIDKAEV